MQTRSLVIVVPFELLYTVEDIVIVASNSWVSSECTRSKILLDLLSAWINVLFPNVHILQTPSFYI
jgi:hypothetical protein